MDRTRTPPPTAVAPNPAGAMTTTDNHWSEVRQSTRRAYAAAGQAAIAAEDCDYLFARGRPMPNEVRLLVAAVTETKGWCDDVLGDIATAGYPTTTDGEDD